MGCIKTATIDKVCVYTIDGSSFHTFNNTFKKLCNVIQILFCMYWTRES